MPRVNEPFLGLGYGWNSGENGWGSGYNEMVKILALLASGGVETIQNDPVSSPVSGKAYIVGTTPTGSWSGKANHIAYWDTDTLTWLFVAPKVGFEVLVKSRGDKGEWYFYGSSNTWSRSPVVSEAIADHKEESDAHSPQNVGADPAGTAAQLIQDSAVPFPDVWIPFNDSLRMLAGYGRDVKLGDDVVARMVNFECSTTRTYIDKSGVMRTAAINEPRFEKQGLLIEGQGTNLMAFSEKAWTRTGGVQMSVGSDGFFVMPSSDSIQFRDNSATAWPAGLSCVMSVYVIGSGKFSLETSAYSAFLAGVSVNVDLDLVTVSDVSKGFITKISNRLYRVGIFVTTATTPQSSLVKGLFVNQVGGNLDIRVNFCQLENTPSATSYIPTNGAAVTRAADFPKLSRWGNDNYYAPITIVCEIDTSDAFIDASANSRRGIFSGYPSTGAFEMLMIEPSSKKIAFAYGTSSFAGGGSLPPAADGTTHIVGARFDGVSNSAFTDGIISAPSAGSPVFGADNGDAKNWLLIGYGAGGTTTRHLFGHIRNFRIWHRALSDAQIKGLK